MSKGYFIFALPAGAYRSWGNIGILKRMGRHVVDETEPLQPRLSVSVTLSVVTRGYV